MKRRNYQQGRKREIVGGEVHAGRDVREGGDNEYGRCRRYVDEGLQCDACQRWFHMQCEQVSQKEYKRISDMGTSVMWLCQWCKINFRNMAGINRELKDENKKLKDENKGLRRRMDSLEEKMRNQKGEIVEKTVKLFAVIVINFSDGIGYVGKFNQRAVHWAESFILLPAIVYKSSTIWRSDIMANAIWRHHSRHTEEQQQLLSALRATFFY